jgi:DNA-binding transcriptional ArsR family regulator
MSNKKKRVSTDLAELSEMLKAVAHPSRMAIMLLLSKNAENKMTVLCIYKELETAQPVISRHLGILKNSGLLSRVAEGSKKYF